MPAPKPVPSVFKILQEFQIGSTAKTGFHAYVKYSQGPPTAAQMTAFASSIGTHGSFYWPKYTHPTTSFVGAVVTDLTDPSYPVGNWVGAAAGSRTGGELPASTSVLVNYKIGRRYRGGKPRSYLPFGTDTDLADASHWTTTFLSALTADWNSFWSLVFGDATWGQPFGNVNVSYYFDGIWKEDHKGNYHRVPTPRDVPLVDTITGQTFSSVLSTQRRRLRPG